MSGEQDFSSSLACFLAYEKSFDPTDLVVIKDPQAHLDCFGMGDATTSEGALEARDKNHQRFQGLSQVDQEGVE